MRQRPSFKNLPKRQISTHAAPTPQTHDAKAMNSEALTCQSQGYPASHERGGNSPRFAASAEEAPGAYITHIWRKM